MERYDQSILVTVIQILGAILSRKEANRSAMARGLRY